MNLTATINQNVDGHVLIIRDDGRPVFGMTYPSRELALDSARGWNAVLREYVQGWGKEGSNCVCAKEME